MSLQKTIEKPTELSGLGLFTGEDCRLRFVPAPPDTGIVFVRTDLPTPVRIPADIGNVGKRARRTTLMNGSVAVETVEHVLSAAAGLDIDNLEIELNSSETPSFDGSTQPFTNALRDAGLAEQDVEQHVFVIEEPITIGRGNVTIAALPGPEDCLDILYDLDYSEAPAIGRQVTAFRLGADDYVRDIAPARTFSLEAEAREMQARGIGAHLTPREVLVIGPDGPIDNEYRLPDECARHKVADLIGDLALLGRRLRGRIVAYRTGHEQNHSLVRRLVKAFTERTRAEAVAGEPVMDIRKIMRLLPHRYPFLMVDRIIELDGDRRVVGIKNVSINEPFFQGHYPGQPILPGVMILEALAQLSGILLSRRLEHTGKVAVLLSMDRVKMRRPVRPGDQLILEAERVHVRSRTGHCKCKAFIAQDLAAEAEIKFMLVDAEPI
ncbi:MAG TPA: UDP-3-O-acyl-N-acetylglucosamine deacetylase [Phycisphaerae bacterium]|nr:UDP-3-O-acyl-N-acetylglucosamine deacetylase [Phycisphaerae bacterium]